MWAELESARGLVAVSTVWRERFGEPFDLYQAALLQRHGGLAEYYPCPTECGCAHKVFEVEPPATSPADQATGLSGTRRQRNFVAVCQCDEPVCADLQLDESDVTLWELSWQKLARNLCAALGLHSKPVDLGLLNTRQIGSWGNEAVPVILTIQSEHSWFRGVALELVSRLKTPFILLAPTTAHFDAASQEIVAAAGAQFFALANIVRWGAGGRLEPVKTPGELLSRFSGQPDTTEVETAKKAFEMIRKLESERRTKAPSVMSVFRLYCIDGLSPAQVARKCRCSRGTVRNRLAMIRAKAGSPERLRQISPHLSRVEDELAASGAEKVYRRNLIYDGNE
jgi:hypothetical protein